MNIKRSKGISLGTISAIAVAVIGFQNCSDVQFATKAPGTEEFLSTSGISINGGAEFTNDVKVKVQLRAAGAAQMYLTNDSTCESGGAWEKYKSERDWKLGHENQRTSVYAKFKGEFGKLYPCIDASITHDNVAPTIEVTQAPPANTNKRDAEIIYRGEDKGSGISRFECQDAQGAYQKCASPSQLTGLTEADHQFVVRAVDRAGNQSNPIDTRWLVDTTAPTIKFTSTPPASSNQPTAIFRFEADDAGSGIETTFCRLDTDGVQGQVKRDCASPSELVDLASNMSERAYRFTIWATDKAGNQSDKVYYDFLVDRSPSGAFQVIGVTGGTDTIKDNLLGTAANPTVHWTESVKAESYVVSIIKQDGSGVCPAKTVAKGTLEYGYSAAECRLVDGQTYVARVVATDSVGNTRAAPDFPFLVDLSPPTVKVTGPTKSNDDKDAKFDLDIEDTGSGIDTAICIKGMVGSADTTTANCKDKDSIDFTNLLPGDHTITVVATDKAGNKTETAPIPWKVTLVVCDPFANIEQKCVKGLKGNLWYLNEEQRKAPFNEVQKYIDHGVQANVTLYMSQLAVPTTEFSKGFKATDGSTLRDNEGNTLTEYFAMRFETLAKLSSTDSAGWYQIAILSDDGAIVDIKENGASAYSTNLIASDGQHSTKMGCGTKAIYLDDKSRIPMMIRYNQGPKYEIALKLIFRKVDSETAAKDETCGKEGTSLFYGNPLAGNPPDYDNFEFGKLKQRGWKIMEPGNFILAEEQK